MSASFKISNICKTGNKAGIAAFAMCSVLLSGSAGALADSFKNGVYISNGSFSNAGIHTNRRARVEHSYRRNKSRVTIHNERKGSGYVTGVDRHNYRHHGRRYHDHDVDIDYGFIVIREPIKPTPCPEDFDCGYRVYEDGTGPRIIIPGLDTTGLPEQDGIYGPNIIRVK